MYIAKRMDTVPKQLILLGCVLFALLATALIPQTAVAQPKQINIEVSKGTLLRLKEPAKNIFIADSIIADVQVKSPTLVYVFGKKQGQTTVYAISDDDRVLYQGEISVSHNLGSLRSAFKSVMPDARINVESYEGLLVLTGHVKNPDQAEEARRMAQEFVGKKNKIINRLAIDTPLQVNLRVRIAEVGRDTMKQLGFNWENSFVNGGDLVGFVQGSDVFEVVANPFTGLPQQNFFTGNNGVNSLAGGFQIGDFSLNTIVDVLEEEGLISVLAEPNLTTLSGEGANFLAGGEFPIPTLDDGQVVIEYKEFGVALTFTPTVLDSGRINMHIKPEVSQLSTAGAVTINGFNIPALSTRRAETTVELGSGQSFAVAGLLQNSVTNNVSKFPWLGDIPILGTLFRSEEFRRQETELVIIVTPYLVKPHNDGEMPMPTDGYQTASDAEMYLKGHTYSSHGPDTPPPAQGANGQKIKSAAGFMLD